MSIYKARFDMDLILLKEPSGEPLCYILGDNQREIAIDEIPIIIAKELDKYNINKISVDIEVPVFANPCGSNDPASKEVEPIVDGEIKIESISIASKFDPKIFSYRIFKLIQKEAINYANDYILDIVSV